MTSFNVERTPVIFSARPHFALSIFIIVLACCAAFSAMADEAQTSSSTPSITQKLPLCWITVQSFGMYSKC